MNDILELMMYAGRVLGLFGFPVYLAAFLYNLFKKRFDRLHYSTMILFFLVFVISALSLAIHFHKFQARENSEAKENLYYLYNAQIAYHGEYSTYAHGAHCFTALGWRPEDNTIYTYYCGSDIVGPLESGLSPAPFHPTTNWPPSVPKPWASSSSFTLVAIGNIDRDPDFNVWVMNDAKILTKPFNDAVNEVPDKIDRLSNFLVRTSDLPLLLVFVFLTPLLIFSLIRDAVNERKRKKEEKLAAHRS